MDRFKNIASRVTEFFKKLEIRGQKEDAYHVLLFGETGSGKSTLVNYLVNFFKGADLDNLKIAIPRKFYQQATENYSSTEKSVKDTTLRKTNDCTMYELVFGDIKFRFIDTPGLSDTAGTHKDDENISKILHAAEETKKLAAIIIVINGTVARATVNLRSTLTRMRGSIPDAILANLIIVLTNCSESTYNFDLKSLKPWQIPSKNVFFMNNSAFSRDPKDWRQKDKARAQMFEQWKDSMQEIENLIERITEFGQTGTNDFKVMRQKRDQIKAKMHGILLEVKKLQNIQDELDSAEAAEKGIDADVKKYSNFIQTKTIDYVELEDEQYHSTFCMIHIDTVYHDHCGLQETDTSGNDIFKGCACMAGTAKCIRCECGHEQHYHACKKIVKKQKTVDDILKDVKANYDLHSGRQGALKQKISSLKNDVAVLKRVLKVKEQMIKECCVKVKEICSQFNFVAELKTVIDTMEANARTLTSVQVRNEADQMIRHIKVLIDHLTSGNQDMSAKGAALLGAAVDQNESDSNSECDGPDNEDQENRNE